nr:hypothetical protein Iba_chr14aCG5050 [Ipomoea batatas]
MPDRSRDAVDDHHRLPPLNHTQIAAHKQRNTCKTTANRPVAAAPVKPTVLRPSQWLPVELETPETDATSEAPPFVLRPPQLTPK